MSMENGDLGNGGGTQSRWSTRPNYRNTASSSDSDIIRICTCGWEVAVRTSWTSTNPGRHFRGCPGIEGKYCGSFQWVDPPMCRRSREIIPGLLALMNQYESAVKRAKDHAELESKRRCRCVALLILCLFCWAASLILAINHYPLFKNRPEGTVIFSLLQPGLIALLD
ncbi:UNVERIFIED_CONTAM: hypothetical protein Sradi_0005000 [Sesamum radiatum]|uniref:GRF-type domain-containing protein n=1 Tax=Sesamum radiatum TaxID=300843 RepID=A0AAW2WHE3_SESRA